MRVRVDFPFCASHILPRHPGRCRSLHGHNYLLQVTVKGRIDPVSGMVMDFDDITSVVNEHVLAQVDHKHLNDVMGNPTAEHIVQWCWKQLAGKLTGLDELMLYETPDCCAVYRGEDEAP
ncbi:MAG: 6-carboxytetrahydropterin synthase QueD [Deltaproteobacteria bacterium]|nr:6-carboxytetrahydropterin synthase QueD [Deltaproteobacteria bacterium]